MTLLPHLLLFSLTFWFPRGYAVNYKMIETWGKPLLAKGPLVIQISWEECLLKCWNDPSCVLIHNTTPNCDYYIIGQVATVEKMTSDSIVAFRLPSTDTCPMLEPLLMEGTVQSTAQIQDQSIQYNVTLENDVWTFSPINFTLSCPSPTAKLITRGNMNLCMDVVQTSECINRPDAANACGNLGIPSTLMGIGSWDENEFVRVSAMNILNNQKTPITYSTLGIWLDGTRKSTCMPPAKKSPTCDGANEFDFWDPYCQSPVFQWRPSQPDGLTGSGSDADCLFFRVSNIPGDVAGVGDMPCYNSTDSYMGICYAGYICGSYPRYEF